MSGVFFLWIYFRLTMKINCAFIPQLADEPFKAAKAAAATFAAAVLNSDNRRFEGHEARWPGS